MAIRLVAVDLDGTLLNSRSEVSPANREALAAASARGVEIVLVTGRRGQSAGKFLSQIPCPVTLISSNGALITSSAREVRYRNFLPCQVAREVLQITREYRPYTATIYDQTGRGQVVIQEHAIPEGPLGWYLAQSPDCLEMHPDLEASLRRDPVQILFGGPPAQIEPIEFLLLASPVAPRIHLSWTKYPARDIALLDVMNQGCTKGAALAFWARQRGIEPREVMAIGDNFNDLEMLQFAGLPVVMGNSSPGFSHQDWFVTLSNDQDGVAAAIQKHVLG